MATGTVNFTESTAVKGSVLHANFSWSGTVKNNISGTYSICQIKNPSGSIVADYNELSKSTSTKQLTATADVAGTWTAKLTIYVGTTGTTYNASVSVTEPPPTPPPPTPGTYTLNITTVPEKCTLTLPGYGSTLSDDLGRAKFSGVEEGQYTITVKKTGYLTAYQGVAVHGNMTFSINLTQEIIIICTPKAVKCVGSDLYECNSAGTAWVLKQANSPTCKPLDEIPDFWTDPIGYIVGVVIAAWDGLTGFIAGAFKTLQQNINNFLADYGGKLAVFIADPVKKITEWISGILPSLTALWDGVTSSINKWWTSTTAQVSKWITDATKGLTSWIDSGFKNIGEWWDETSKTITSWFSTTWASMTSFTAWIGTQVQGVIDTTVSGLQTWVEGFVSAFTEAIAGDFFTGLDRGVKAPHHSPLDITAPTENDILKGLNKYMEKYREDREKQKVK